MSGYDANQVFVVPVHPAARTVTSDKPSDILEQLKEFLLGFRIGEEFIYR